MNFDKIYADNHRSILTYIISKVNDFGLAQEMTNDVFIKLSTRLDKFDKSKASLKTWIMTFAKNAVIDYYRKNKISLISIDNTINEDSEDKKISLINTIKDNELTPYEVLKSKDTVKNINDAIYNLKGRNFDISYYFFIEQLSYAEIAKELNLTLGTVKGQLFRIRKELQNKLTLV